MVVEPVMNRGYSEVREDSNGIENIRQVREAQEAGEGWRSQEAGEKGRGRPG